MVIEVRVWTTRKVTMPVFEAEGNSQGKRASYLDSGDSKKFIPEQFAEFLTEHSALRAVLIDFQKITSANDTCYYAFLEGELITRLQKSLSRPITVAFVVGSNWSRGKSQLGIPYYDSVQAAAEDSLNWPGLKPTKGSRRQREKASST